MNILIVDDEKGLRQGIKKRLSIEGYSIFEAADTREAWEVLHKEPINIILLDLRLGEENGYGFLVELKKQEPEISVIIITGYGTIDSAVACIKAGATDYLTKPIDQDILLTTVSRTMERIFLLTENAGLKQSVDDFLVRENVFPSVKRLPTEADTIIEKVKNSNVNILITGETGTGKEVTAKRIHFSGSYKQKPFVSINCSSLNDNLIESELFGHEKGAFTGAVSRKPGRFEIVGNGTLFLDEIGDMSPSMQAKLLRVLEERTFERVGGTLKISTNCRIIAATNRNLNQDIIDQRFREDLYYRLNVVEIFLPPLRERIEEIPNLVQQFIDEANREYGKKIQSITPDLMTQIMEYRWPGNIRQLKNVIVNAVLLSEGETIDALNIPDFNTNGKAEVSDIGCMELKTVVERHKEDIERKYIARVLNDEQRNITNTASRLGISRKTLYQKIEYYSL